MDIKLQGRILFFLSRAWRSSINVGYLSALQMRAKPNNQSKTSAKDLPYN
jgi:hypothetical protein